MKKRQLVGILNCTPDSYFEKGRWLDREKAIEYGLNLFQEGADIVDIGGESTRPDKSISVDSQEELRRVLPVIKGIRKKTELPLSIDTFKPEVAEVALDEGVNWINDITGLANPHMRELAKKYPVKICLMHMYGKPHTIPTYTPRDVIEDIVSFFKERVTLLLNEGIEPWQIIIDPGIGGGSFGKTPEEVLTILRNLSKIRALGYPILISLSRKSFLQKILQKPASEVLSTTLALNTMALLEGALYIRVHDVAEHRDIFTIFENFDSLKN